MGVERYSVAAGLSEGGSLEQGGWGGKGGLQCSATPRHLTDGKDERQSSP